MNIVISRDKAAQLYAEAAKAWPEECCGLLYGRANRIERIVPTSNVAAMPHRHFEIDPVALIAAHKVERKAAEQGSAGQTDTQRLIGFYHSHPDGLCAPSAEDARQAAPDGRIWLIVAGDDIGVWRAEESGAVHGRFAPLDLRITPS